MTMPKCKFYRDRHLKFYMAEKAEKWKIQDSKLGISGSRLCAVSVSKQNSYAAPTVHAVLGYSIHLRASLALSKMALVFR